MELLHVLYSIVGCLICACFGLSSVLVVHILRSKCLSRSIYPNDIVFIKKKPGKYCFIKGNHDKAQAIYPYYSDTEWTSIEANVLIGNNQSILCQYKEQLYMARITRIRYLGYFALLITLYELEDGLLSREEEEIFDKTDLFSMCVDSKFSIIYKNKRASSLQITNLYDNCNDKDVLIQIRDGLICINKIISLDIDGETRYFNFSFYPKTYLGTNEVYYFIIGYEVSKKIQYYNKILVNNKITRILRDGIQDLFVHANTKQSFQNILFQLSEVLGAQWAFIYQVYGDKIFMEYEWHDVNVKHEDVLHSSINKEYYTKFITSDAKPFIIGSGDISDERREIWDSLGIKRKIIVPLFSQNKELWGLVGFGCNSWQESRYLEESLGLIQVIATVINVVIILQQDRKEIESLNSQLNDVIEIMIHNTTKENEISKEINTSLRSINDSS